MPADGKLLSNRATVATGNGLKAVGRPGGWSNRAEANESLANLHLESREALASVPLAIHREAKASSGTTVIERAWIWSQLGVGVRQDRATYRFTTSEGRFQLTLPRQASTGDVVALFDGRPVRVAIEADRRFSFPLPDDASGQPHTLELVYRFSRNDAGRLGIELEAPQLADGMWVQRLYWQVSLPPHEHVLAPPPGFVSESTWRLQGLWLGRQPLRSPADLEAWSGAERRSHAVGGPSGNTYLFSSLGPAERMELWIARRTWLVFVGSLTALGMGLLMIYAPRLRRVLLLVLVCGVISLGVLYPEPVVLLLQAASLGAALVLLAALLERMVADRRRRALPSRRAASSIVERGALVEKPPLPIAASHSSTRTAALAVPAASPEAGP
jgi:hypothetical protein